MKPIANKALYSGLIANQMQLVERKAKRLIAIATRKPLRKPNPNAVLKQKNIKEVLPDREDWRMRARYSDLRNFLHYYINWNKVEI